jgi:RNase P subunit RPR2
MSETRTIACPKCGAANDVLVPGDNLDEQLRQASFTFACRVCGTDLPPATQEPVEPK